MRSKIEAYVDRDSVPTAGEPVKGRGRVRTVGLDPETFADVHNRRTEVHTSGAVEFERQQNAYNGSLGGAFDRIDRGFDL